MSVKPLVVMAIAGLLAPMRSGLPRQPALPIRPPSRERLPGQDPCWASTRAMWPCRRCSATQSCLWELADLAGSARFDHLAVDVDGAQSPFRVPSLEYPVEISENAFSDEDGRVRGGFFGPAHEEMAGVLDDRDVRLLAGFGGKR